MMNLFKTLIFTLLVPGTVVVIGYEEPVLRRSFGEAYERYTATIPRWFGRRASPG